MESPPAWFVWALLSAAFAALTAIFAKLGLEGGDSDLATLIRTVVILLVLVAVFAVIFLGERPGLREWCGIALVVAGARLRRPFRGQAVMGLRRQVFFA